MLMRFIISYIVIVNIIAFVLYGVDKRKAKKNQWRIAESTLILIAFIGGSLGALLGMIVFHHKTKHWKFKILIPLCLIVDILLGYIYLWK